MLMRRGFIIVFCLVVLIGAAWGRAGLPSNNPSLIYQSSACQSGVTLNGASGGAYLSVASQTGAASSSLITASLWFRLYSLSSAQQLFIVPGDAPGLGAFVNVQTNGSIRFGVGQAVFEQLVVTSAPGAVGIGAWHHIFASADTTLGPGSRIYNLYLDGANLSPTIIEDFGAAPLTYLINGNSFGTPSDSGTASAQFDTCDFWLAYNQYIAPSHISAFISGCQPVFLGSNGQLPTGTAPTYFFHGGVPAFATNLGTGDPATLVGMLSGAPPPGPAC